MSLQNSATLADRLHHSLFEDLTTTGWHRASSCPYASAWALMAALFSKSQGAQAISVRCVHYLLQSQQESGAWGCWLQEQIMITPQVYAALRFAYEQDVYEKQALQNALLKARVFLRTTGELLYPQLAKNVCKSFRPVRSLVEHVGHPEWTGPVSKLVLPEAEYRPLPAQEHMCFQLSGLYELLPALWQKQDEKLLVALEQCQLTNGSWWCVTDLTSMALLALEFGNGNPLASERGWQFLLQGQNSDGGFSQFYDCELFLSAYVGFVYATLAKTMGIHLPKQLLQMEDWLRAQQQKQGLWSFTAAFPGGDLDDTAWVILWLVDGCGATAHDPAIKRAMLALIQHQLPDGSFPSWAGLTGDTDVAAHALQAFYATGQTTEAFVERTHAYLLSKQCPDGAWQGTWHRSAIYGTAQVLHALVRGPVNQQTNEAIYRGVVYLLNQINSKGDITREEVGIALWGLTASNLAQDQVLPLDRQMLQLYVKEHLQGVEQQMEDAEANIADQPKIWSAQFSYTAKPLQIAALAAVAYAMAD